MRGTQNTSSRKQKKTHAVLSRLWSIRALNLFINFSIVLITALSIWVAVFFSTQSSIIDLAAANRQLLTRRLREFIFNFIIQSPGAAKVIHKAFVFDNTTYPDHISNVENELKLRQNYLGIMQDNFPTVGAIFYADEATGRLNGLQRDDLLRFLAMYVDRNNTYNFFTIDEDNGERAKLVASSGYYDGRVRPWYVYAKAHGTGWAPTFLGRTYTPQLLLPFVDPIYNRTDGKLLGVNTAAIFLSGMNDYLSKIDTVENSRVFIMERNENMIGSSIGKVEGYDSQGKITRLIARNHTDHVVRDATMFLVKKFGSVNNLAEDNQTFDMFDTEGTRQLVQILLIKDAYGLDWIAVYVVPFYSIYGGLLKATVIAIVVGIVIVALAAVVSTIFSICITKPLSNLKSQLKLMSNMQLPADMNTRHLSNLYEYKTMEQGLRQLYRGLDNFKKFLPGDVVRDIVKQNNTVELGVHRKMLTVMFCDIVGFTTLTESADGKVLIDIMQEFFTIASNAVYRHNGTVDKYIGDCVMAFWNSPQEDSEHALRAVETATTIIEDLKVLNKSFAERGYPLLGVRMGINTSEVFVGLVGSPTRMNYTTLGDGVNVASRLESLNNYFKSNLIVGECTWQQASVQEHFAARFLDFVYLKGKNQAIAVYEILCRKTSITPQLEHDIRVYEEIRSNLSIVNIEKVKELTKSLIEHDPNNEHYPALLLHRRLLNWKEGDDPFLKLTEK